MGIKAARFWPFATAVVALLAAPAASAADIQTFARGTLIIPEEATFQTGCGSISAYGLVWRLLKENRVGGAFAAGGAFNGTHGTVTYPSTPLTIYWIINGDKASPNRCTPSTRHTPPAPATDSKWTDGCDFTITNSNPGEQPVVPVDFSVPWPATGIYPFALVPSYSSTIADVRPAYPTPVTLNNNNTAPRFTTIRYMGGPFVIDSTDARRVIEFLRASTDGNATTGILGFTSNKSATTCSCTLANYTLSVASSCHYVQMHQATIQFDAPVNKRINQTPPRIALLDTGDGVSNGVLTDYLNAANLNFPGAAGCPPGSTAGCTQNGSSPGVMNQGEIYDEFNAIQDLISTPLYPLGLLNQTIGGKALYRLLWTPHWVINAGGNNNVSCGDVGNDGGDQAKDSCINHGYYSNRKSCSSAVENWVNNHCTNPVSLIDAYAAAYAGIQATKLDSEAWSVVQCTPSPSTTNPLPCPGWNSNRKTIFNEIVAAVQKSAGSGATVTDVTRKNALDNIAYFSNLSGNGLFAECASLETYEGSSEAGSVKVPQLATSTNFMYTNTISINGLTIDESQWDGRNCTDPDYPTNGTGGECALYPNAGDPFSQLGDFKYQAVGGHVHQYWPLRTATPASSLKDGVKRLALSWQNYTPGAYTNTVPYTYSVNNGWDFFTLGQKDNNPDKATIVYLAGHTYKDSIAGSRIVLNTLMNLGSMPVTSDRSVAAPVAFDDANGNDTLGNKALLFSSTYKAVTGTLIAGNTDYDPVRGSKWMWPFTRGDLRAHCITGGSSCTALAGGLNNLTDALLFSADANMPAPGTRNVFTYVGGKVTVNPTLGLNNRINHPVLQTGWTPVKVAASEIVTPTASGTSGFGSISGCVDVIKYARVMENGVSSFGFDQGADGVCDLQQLLQYTVKHDDGAGNLQTADRDAVIAEAPYSAQLMSILRGYCYATAGQADGVAPTSSMPNSYAPALTDCNRLDYQDNLAHPGGLVHSTPAIVPPSVNIPPKVSGSDRPTVAYVGGFDGQLHAFYVSGGAGYDGPAAAQHVMNTGASGVFTTDYATNFRSNSGLPGGGTELWSYMPATQFPFLRGNNARVDSSPAVQDVFVDMTGSGVREWHTVVVASVGRTGREVFAIDVTNPLAPVLLWDLVGGTYKLGGIFPEMASAILTGDDTGGTSWSHKWTQGTASYVLPPGTDSGRAPTGLFNYYDMGGSSGITVGQMRAGIEPVYAVILSSNKGSKLTTPAMGLEVFGIDVASGQKLWQWEQGYQTSTSSDYRSADNMVPAVVALRPGTDGVRRLFAGDMEGRLWELDSVSGMNVNVARTGCTTGCAFEAFDTQGTSTAPQPITSNIAVAIVPPSATGDLLGYDGQPVILFGTGGADWVPGSVGGKLHLALTAEAYRKSWINGGVLLADTPPRANHTPAEVLASIQASGVLQEPNSNWPQAFGLERIYGNLTVAGRTVFIPTGTGQTNDIMKISARQSGKTYRLNLGAAAAPTPITGFALANFGGVAVYHQAVNATSSNDFVLGAEVNKIAVEKTVNAGVSGDQTKDLTLNPDGSTGSTFRLLNWMRRLLSQ